MTTTTTRRAASAIAGVTLLIAAAACGSDDDTTTDSPAPTTAAATTLPASTTAAPQTTAAQDTTVAAGALYSTTQFRAPLDIVVPAWLDPQPEEDSAQFITWRSPDGARAVRILLPVEVYPPGSDAPTAPPDDFQAYVLDQADGGAQLTDVAETEIDGHPATVLTGATDQPLDGSLGCPETGVPADACFGFQPDLVLRMAVTDSDAGPLLIWLRLDETTDLDMAAEATRFDELLAGIRFANREPESAGEAVATPYDGEYQWTLTAEDAEKNFLDDPATLVTFPWTFTLTLRDGRATLTVDAADGTTESDRGTYTVDGDRIDILMQAARLSFTVTVDPDGTIHASAAEPMDAGDEFVSTSKPWTKIG